MKKKILLLGIILFPGLIWYLFELTQANFKKMPYFGPKTVSTRGDSLYYKLPKHSFDTCWAKRIALKDSSGNEYSAVDIDWDSLAIDTGRYPVFCILFLDSKLKKDGYKLGGLLDYAKYKKDELSQVPLFFISPALPYLKTEVPKGRESALKGDFDSIPITLPSFIPARLHTTNRDSFLRATYFNQKPYYVMDYFAVLVDKERHIRGYYDPTFNAEIKRMIAEYKHLRIRDAYAETLKQNDIKKK